MTLSPRPRDVPTLLSALMASDPGRPRITWYGEDGERVELSARVLENWVAKTANLLVEEVDAEPGTPVWIGLPAHWRSAVWVLATYATGAVLVARPTDALVVVSDDPPVAPGRRAVAVALPALSRAARPPTPGVLDYNAEVAGQGDVFSGTGPATPLPDVPRLVDGQRLLVTSEAWDPVRHLFAPLLADGSVVICAPSVPAERVAAIRSQERVTGEAS